MTGPGRRFDPAELDGVVDQGGTDRVDVLGVARELEALAARDTVVPSAGFDDQVMAAIANEAPPRVVVAGGTGLGAGLAAFFGAVGSAWRVATSGGRPVAVRAQALAFVLLVVLAGGSLASAAAFGAASFLDRSHAPTPTVAPAPTVPPTRTLEPERTQTPQSAPTDVSGPATSTEPTETPEATETPRGTDDHETPEPTRTARPNDTPRPTRTPRATETPEPSDSEAPEGSDSPGSSGGSGGGHGGSGSG